MKEILALFLFGFVASLVAIPSFRFLLLLCVLMAAGGMLTGLAGMIGYPIILALIGTPTVIIRRVMVGNERSSRERAIEAELAEMRSAGELARPALEAKRAVYQQALGGHPRETDAEGWARIQVILGRLEEAIGDVGGGPASYERAALHAQASLEVFKGGKIRELATGDLARVRSKLRAWSPGAG